MDVILKIVQTINMYLSDYILIFLLVGVGLYYTIRTRFVQVRCFGEGMKAVFGNFSLKGGKQASGLSSFQALAAAIAAQVGTGNIVGACGAILVGGPGAIFWMWIIAFFGMATIYAEAVLAQKTRTVAEDGTVLGGPVYYIKQAFKGTFGKILSIFFAISTFLALGFMGAMVQSNSISGSITTVVQKLAPNASILKPLTEGSTITVLTIIVGAVIAIAAALVFIGGVQRLGAVTEKIVPIMAGLYLIGGIVVLAINIEKIPETFGLIFKYAFMPNAIIGGSIGFAIKQAISQGAKRGLFSNEAGMGSTPHAHALANVKDPHDQGVVAMIGVFIDTFVVLNITAFVVISTLFTKGGPLDSAAGLANIEAIGLSKANLAQVAFGTAFGSETIGSIFVAVCLLFFAFSTILSWNMFGKINFNYLFGKKSLIIYSIVAVIFIFLGALLSNDLVWELTDMFNNLMVIPNALALFVLGSMVAMVAKKHLKKNKESDQE